MSWVDVYCFCKVLCSIVKPWWCYDVSKIPSIVVVRISVVRSKGDCRSLSDGNNWQQRTGNVLGKGGETATEKKRAQDGKVERHGLPFHALTKHSRAPTFSSSPVAYDLRIT